MHVETIYPNMDSVKRKAKRDIGIMTCPLTVSHVYSSKIRICNSFAILSDWKLDSHFIRMHKINHKLMLVVRNFHVIPLYALWPDLGLSVVKQQRLCC